MSFFEKCLKIKSDKHFLQTPYFSGDMASIILVQRRIKYWVKDSAGVGEDEGIFDIVALSKATLKKKLTETRKETEINCNTGRVLIQNFNDE